MGKIGNGGSLRGVRGRDWEKSIGVSLVVKDDGGRKRVISSQIARGTPAGRKRLRRPWRGRKKKTRGGAEAGEVEGEVEGLEACFSIRVLWLCTYFSSPCSSP